MAIHSCFQSEQSCSVPLLVLHYKQLLGTTLLLSIVQSFFYTPYSKWNVMWPCIFLSFEIKSTQKCKMKLSWICYIFPAVRWKIWEKNMPSPFTDREAEDRYLCKAILVADREGSFSLSVCLVWWRKLDDIHVVVSSTKQFFCCSIRWISWVMKRQTTIQMSCDNILSNSLWAPEVKLPGFCVIKAPKKVSEEQWDLYVCIYNSHVTIKRHMG